MVDSCVLSWVCHSATTEIVTGTRATILHFRCSLRAVLPTPLTPFVYLLEAATGSKNEHKHMPALGSYCLFSLSLGICFSRLTTTLLFRFDKKWASSCGSYTKRKLFAWPTGPTVCSTRLHTHCMVFISGFRCC